jgi:hypothetical protein
MIFRSFLRLATRASLVALAVASVAVGCSRQGEGERCDFDAAGDDDCDSGLVCTTCERLADRVTDRCCPPGGGSSDSRCALATFEGTCLTEVGSGGSAGAAGTAGAGTSGAGTSGAGAGGMSSGGAAGTAGASSGGTAGEDDPAGAGGA